LWATSALPQNISTEPMPENFTSEDYLNTTYPYSQVNPLDYANESEGNHPLYVLVFADEEEREIIRSWGGQNWTWEEWATLQLERGDQPLAVNFGIDIRILGFLSWNSTDYIHDMDSLWLELEAETEQYLRTWYNGDWWSNYVDAVIGITAQEVDGIGRSPGEEYLDEGRIFTLIKWQVYWADDNIVTHEVSHLFYAPDHDANCCFMAHHAHWQGFVIEGGWWWVGDNVECWATTSLWCTTCNQTIQQNSGRYPLQALTISASLGGETDPAPGKHAYSKGETVSVIASANPVGFDHWLLDGTIAYENPINVTMTSDHTLEAYFYEPVCAMKTLTNGNFYIPSLEPHLLRIENWSSNQYLVGDQTGETGPFGTITNYPDGTVDMADVSFIIDKFMISEDQSGWDYTADVVPDRTIDMADVACAINNCGNSGAYYAGFWTGITIVFSTGQYGYPNSNNGFVTIPEGAISFNVTRFGNTIGAMIIFW
jgi:hypothetical protein